MPMANNIVNSPAEEPNLNTAEGLLGSFFTTELKIKTCQQQNVR